MLHRAETRGWRALTKIAVLLYQVDLRQDVDVGQLEVQHGAQREHENGDILGRVRDIVCVAEVDGS